MKKLIITLVAVAITGSAAWQIYAADAAGPAGSATAARSDQANKVRAVGTIEPNEVVDISSQVPGRIKSLGIDPKDKEKRVDYGSPVERGSILALVDDTPYKLRVQHARAAHSLALAELEGARAKLELAEELRQESVTAKYNYRIAKAALAAAEAAVAQKKVAVEEAELNLGYTKIVSPIDGNVIDRRVSVGQTVSASPNSPLFLIADVKNLVIWASVNEADVSKIHNGQPVRFAVDAFPGKIFQGEVKQMRLNAAVNQNVVTYTVVVAISSPTDKLLPYMTANLEFE